VLVKLPAGLGMIRPVMQSESRTMFFFEPSKSRCFSSVRIGAPSSRLLASVKLVTGGITCRILLIGACLNV
jgi:hypothetical protein